VGFMSWFEIGVIGVYSALLAGFSYQIYMIGSGGAFAGVGGIFAWILKFTRL
jgi:hypothetical protein